MTEEAFGDGLELAAQQAAAAAQVVSTAGVPATPTDFMSLVRAKIGGLDEITEDQFADFVIEQQAKAQEAESLRQQLEQFQAQQTLAASQQLAQAKAAEVNATTPAQQAAARKRQLEIVESFSEDDLQFVKPDPSGFGYLPIQAMSVPHLQAAERLNAASQRAARNGQAISRNPYAPAEEVVSEAEARIMAKMEERWAAYEAKLSPVEKLIAQQQEAAAAQDFATKHADLLFKDDGTMTQLGVLTNNNYIAGMEPEAALAKAQELATQLGLGTPAAAAPAKPSISVSKVSKANGSKPTSFVDGLSAASRLPVEHPEGGNVRKPTTINQFQKDFLESLKNGV